MCWHLPTRGRMLHVVLRRLSERGPGCTSAMTIFFLELPRNRFGSNEHAVPRYCKFAPDSLANIYAGEAALADVTCQVCKRLFRVAFSTANWSSGTIADAIRSRTLHFGDPPNVKCCGNAHMNSEPRRV